jgi:hypothetical protein
MREPDSSDTQYFTCLLYLIYILSVNSEMAGVPHENRFYLGRGQQSTVYSRKWKKSAPESPGPLQLPQLFVPENGRFDFARAILLDGKRSKLRQYEEFSRIHAKKFS